MAMRKTASKKATKKPSPRKSASVSREEHRTGRRAMKLDHDPREFLREIIDEVIFNDGSLEEADKRIAAHFKDRGDREREQMGRQMMPLVSRLASAAPSLASMVSARAL